jgi:hypothetical protein
MHSTQRALGAETTHCVEQSTKKTKLPIKDSNVEAGYTTRRPIKSTPFELCSLISCVRLPLGSQQLKTCCSKTISLTMTLSSHAYRSRQRAQNKITRLELTPRAALDKAQRKRSPPQRGTLRLAVSLFSLQNLLLNPLRTPPFLKMESRDSLHAAGPCPRTRSAPQRAEPSTAQ